VVMEEVKESLYLDLNV